MRSMQRTSTTEDVLFVKNTITKPKIPIKGDSFLHKSFT